MFCHAAASSVLGSVLGLQKSQVQTSSLSGSGKEPARSHLLGSSPSSIRGFPPWSSLPCTFGLLSRCPVETRIPMSPASRLCRVPPELSLVLHGKSIAPFVGVTDAWYLVLSESSWAGAESRETGAGSSKILVKPSIITLPLLFLEVGTSRKMSFLWA